MRAFCFAHDAPLAPHQHYDPDSGPLPKCRSVPLVLDGQSRQTVADYEVHNAVRNRNGFGGFSTS
jgi:hypothetical protein